MQRDSCGTRARRKRRKMHWKPQQRNQNWNQQSFNGIVVMIINKSKLCSFSLSFFCLWYKTCSPASYCTAFYLNMLLLLVSCVYPLSEQGLLLLLLRIVHSIWVASENWLVQNTKKKQPQQPMKEEWEKKTPKLEYCITQMSNAHQCRPSSSSQL